MQTTSGGSSPCERLEQYRIPADHRPGRLRQQTDWKLWIPFLNNLYYLQNLCRRHCYKLLPLFSILLLTSMRFAGYDDRQRFVFRFKFPLIINRACKPPLYMGYANEACIAHAYYFIACSPYKMLELYRIPAADHLPSLLGHNISTSKIESCSHLHSSMQGVL